MPPVPTTTLPALPADTSADAIAARLADYAARAHGAFADNTARAIRSDTAIFATWCSERGVPHLPASAETLADYIEHQGARRAPATVARHVASVAHLHRAAGLADPAREPAVRLALRTVRRTHGTRQRQAAPLNETTVQRVAGALATRPGSPASDSDFDSPSRSNFLRDLRDFALLRVARAALLRRSELVELTAADLTVDDDGAGSILVRRSKTDQDGAGARLFLDVETVAAVRAWTEAAGVVDGPLFRSLRRGGAVQARGLSPVDVARAFKRLAELAGLDAAAISGHSARVGMAQDLLAAGATLPELMQAGRWKSPAMPARYTERQAARSGAVARFFEKGRS